MKVEITTGRTGKLTAKYNNLFLHSFYSPEIEAQRFVEKILIDFIPEYIFITEPALSYCATFLQEKFPSAKLIAIRYTHDFSAYDYLFHEVIYFTNENENLNLQKKFSEESLLKSLFLAWENSSRAFEIDLICWKKIKDEINKAKSLLLTKQYFSQKWLINSINFITNIKNPIILKEKINTPVIICASGPSLLESIEIIKLYKDKLFIVAVSSALKVLLEKNIIPDLCLSTDGGYYAGRHLKSLLKNPNIKLALNIEAYCQKDILYKSNIIPLVYQDDLCSRIYQNLDLPYMPAKANGTVSGTALDFIYQNTEENIKIFFAGLDLACQKGFQHSQNNELELDNCTKDNRIFTKEKRLYPSELNSTSLKIYEDWFSTQDYKNRVFRIINPSHKKNTLGKIKDLEAKDFLDFLKTHDKAQDENKKSIIFKKEVYTYNKKILKENILKLSKEDVWFKEFFPMDYINFQKSKDKSKIHDIIEEKNQKFLCKILKRLDE